jgi:autotransporter-associated beta strand protein
LSASGLLLGSTEIIEFGTYPTSPVTAAATGYSMGALRFDIVNGSTLSAPSGLEATTNGSQVVLDWNDALNATSYSVYRSTTSGGPYGTAIATSLTTSTFTDNTVLTGSTYYYVVTASDASSESATSNEKSIAVVIPAPTGLTRTQGDSVMNLDWADSTSPIFASYSVYRSATAGGPYTSIATGLTASAYSDSGLTNGTTYYYVVKALDNVISAESANSDQVSGTPYVAVSGSTLYARLDGSVSASVTAASTIVSAWADQTANGFNASTGVGTVLYPGSAPSQTGLSGLDMGFTAGAAPKSTLAWFSAARQDQWLDFSSGAGALPYGGFAVFAVVHPNIILGGVNRDVVMSSTESEFALRYEGGRPQVRLGSSILQGTAGAVTAGQTVVLAVTYNATTGALQLWDSKSGTSTSATVPAADFSSTADVFLGGSSNPDQYMKGMLGEAKVYRGVLTDTEFDSERVNLMLKWAIPGFLWSGAQSSEWSTNAIGGSKNWVNNSGSADYADGSAVFFDNTGTNKIVEITVADVTPSSVTFNSDSYTLQGSKTIAGSAPVAVTSGASLKLGSSNLLPDAGKLTLAGTLDLNGKSDTINGLDGAGALDNIAAGGASVLTIGNGDGAGAHTGVIQNTTGSIALVKTGTGLQSLAGANTFTGGVTIKNGTLESKTTQTTLGTGTVTMGGTGSTGATFITGQSNSNPFAINAPDSGTVVIGANGPGSGFTLSGGISLNGNLTIQTFDNVISGTLKAESGFIGGITGTGNVVLNNFGLAANTISFTTAAINHTGSITLQGTGIGDTTIGANIGANVTGITQNSATSPLILSGANTYPGNLTVNAGLVRLSNAPDPLNANTGNDASTVTIAATGATLDLTYIGTDKVDKLVIGSTQRANGVYGKEGSVLPVIGISQITGDGTLTVGTATPPGFSSWITGTFANGAVTNQGANDDFDKDGISNLVEYAVAGQDPTVGNPAISTFSAGTLSFTKREGTNGLTYAIQESTDLTTWIEVTGGSYVNSASTISFTLTPGTPKKKFLRLQLLSN